MGNNELAYDLFNSLTHKGKEIVDSNKAREEVSMDKGVNKSLSNGYYLQALGELGKGDKAAAEKLLNKSLEAYKNNLWAKYYFTNE